MIKYIIRQLITTIDDSELEKNPQSKILWGVNW